MQTARRCCVRSWRSGCITVQTLADNWPLGLKSESNRRMPMLWLPSVQKTTPVPFREYQAIEDDLGFPKWEFEGLPKLELIELVMTVTPTILDGCSEEVMSRLRMAMALQCLAGRHAPKNLLRGLDTGIRLDAETAARMIYFLARHTEDIQKWKQMRITHVTHFAAAGSCSVCTSSNGQKWRIEQAPELPHALCTHPCGCRCLYLPIPNT